MRLLHAFSAMLADVVFPRLCAGCGARIEPGATWCGLCTTALLQETGTPFCPRCGHSRGPWLDDEDGCPSCRTMDGALDGFARVGHYRGLAGEMVRNYKLRGGQHLAAALSRLLADAILGRPWADEVDMLVPVPAPWLNRLRCGFQPVALLAGRAGRHLGLPVRPVLRIRGKKRRQTGLSPSQRSLNVQGTMSVLRRADVRGRAVCLIDDVCTTGATLREAARVLRRAGAVRVYAAVVARAGAADIHLDGG